MNSGILSKAIFVSVALGACSPSTGPADAMMPDAMTSDATTLDTVETDSTTTLPEVSCPTGETMCATASVSACFDLQTDALHCGSCETACAMGQACVRGACSCGASRTACGDACVDTQSDPANCGRCGNPCTAGQTCSAGACQCPSMQTLCSGMCVNLQIDPSNCGTCGYACSATSSCNVGGCSSLCGSGTTSCGGMCVNPQTDASNCGSCANVCGASRSCVFGRCLPPNNTRATAATLTLTAGETTVTGNTDGASHDGPSVPCACTSGADVWYRFTLAQEELVYFDTAGSSFDTSLVVTDATGNAVSAQTSLGSPNRGLCNDDSACPAGAGEYSNVNQSRTWGRLAAGTYYVVVGGCTSGAFTLHAQHLRIDSGASFAGYIAAGIGGLNGELPTRNATVGGCGGAASAMAAGEEFRMFVTCGGTAQLFSVCASDGGVYERHQLFSDFDPVLYVRSASSGAELACNDNGTTMGAIDCRGSGGDMMQLGARLNDVATPRGMHAIFVDSITGGDASIAQMAYTLRYAVRNSR